VVSTCHDDFFFPARHPMDGPRALPAGPSEARAVRRVSTQSSSGHGSRPLSCHIPTIASPKSFFLQEDGKKSWAGAAASGFKLPAGPARVRPSSLERVREGGTASNDALLPTTGLLCDGSFRSSTVPLSLVAVSAQHCRPNLLSSPTSLAPTPGTVYRSRTGGCISCRRLTLPHVATCPHYSASDYQ